MKVEKKRKRKKIATRKGKRLTRIGRLNASRKRNKKIIRKSKRFRNKKTPSVYELIKKRRKEIWREIYSKYTFMDSPLTIDLNDEIGVETGDVDTFIAIGKAIVDSNTSMVRLNVSNCVRLWPSAITLICSFHQWRNLIYSMKCKRDQKVVKPKIAATRPQSKALDSYLTHCGFYDYVGYPSSSPDSKFSPEDVVKIELERDNDKIEIRCHQTMKLIKEKSVLSLDDIERVQCMVIPEIINNVTEHGQNCIDKGWWMLAQYHENHKIISICIADNGLGIRDNLLSGPQSEDIKQRIGSSFYDDEKFIELAFNEQVSGASEAHLKNVKKGVNSKYPRGSNRGNGLKRIKKACLQCAIKLSVFSQKGYVMYDEHGELSKYGTFSNRIFGGTMYNLIVPAK